jgi:N-acetyltransferase
MNLQPLLLEGIRVKLIPLHESHKEAIYHAGNDPRIWEVGMDFIGSYADADQYVTSAMEEQARDNSIPFSVYDKETGRIVGCTRLFDISVPHRLLEIGYTWYNPSVWRSRVNTECKYLLLRHSFETLHMIRVQFKTDLRNTRSQAAIARLGAIKEGVLRNHRILLDGYIRDSVMFSITHQEWPSVKERLEGFLT